MATKTITITSCDLCGEEPASSVTISVGSKTATLDVCANHRGELDAAVSPFLKSTTKSAKKATKPARAASRGDLGDVRAWAGANGFTVSERGRIATAIVDAYDQAMGGAKPARAKRSRKKA